MKITIDNKKPVRILLDSGASASIISKDFVVKEKAVNFQLKV